MIGARVITATGESYEVKEETPRLWVAHETSRYGTPTKWRFPKKGGDVREARNERGRTRTLFLTQEAADRAKRERDDARWISTYKWSIAKPSAIRQDRQSHPVGHR